MTKDDIIEMARKADALGYVHYAGDEPNQWMFSVKQLERFAALIASRVAAEEREACAKVFDDMANQMVADMEPSTAVFWVRSKAAEIRARGENKMSTVSGLDIANNIEREWRVKCDAYINLLDATTKELDRAMELLRRAENEMRYAGWTRFESDNPARNGVYEDVKKFLK